MNRIFLVGHVGKEPVTKTFENGKIVSFTLATSEYYTKDGERKQITDWHNIVCNTKMADTLEKYVKKGMLLLVEGKSRTRSYDNKDGGKVYITEVLLDRFEFLSKSDDKPEVKETKSEIQEVETIPSEDDGNLPF